MSYNCPMCGEIETTDVKFTCLKCGSYGVKEVENDEYMCPNCGQTGADELRMTCAICGSEKVIK